MLKLLKNILSKKILSRNEKTNISYIEAEEIYLKENGLIIDVRNRDEFNNKHLKNAINIPLYEIEEKIEEITLDKNQAIMLYCKSGKRSRIARNILQDKGYLNVYTIDIKI